MLSFNYYSRTNRIKKHKNIPSLHSLIYNHSRKKPEITTVLELPFQRMYGMPIEKQHFPINELNRDNMILGELFYDNPQQNKQEISEQAMKELEMLSSIEQNNKLNNLLQEFVDVNPIQQCQYTDQDQDVGKEDEFAEYYANRNISSDSAYKCQQLAKQSKSLSLQIEFQHEEQNEQEQQDRSFQIKKVKFQNERVQQANRRQQNSQNIFEVLQNSHKQMNNPIIEKSQQKIQQQQKEIEQSNKLQQISHIQIKLDNQIEANQIIQNSHQKQKSIQQQNIPQQVSPVRIYSAQSQIVINVHEHENMGQSVIPQSISTPLNSMLLEIYNTPEENRNSMYFKQLNKNQNVDQLLVISSEKELQVSQRLQATIRGCEFLDDQLPPQGSPMFRKTISEFVSQQKSEENSKGISLQNRQQQNKYKVPEQQVIPETKAKKNFKQAFIKKPPNSRPDIETNIIQNNQQSNQTQRNEKAKNIHMAKQNNTQIYQQMTETNGTSKSHKKVNFKVMIKKINK